MWYGSIMRALPALVLATACLGGPALATGQSATSGTLVVADPATGTYHVPACPSTKALKSPLMLNVGQAHARNLKPHDCQRAIAAAKRSGVGSQLVWVDLTARRYHLAGCSLIGLPRAQVRLDQAAAKYKPCNACKPPAPGK